jgi:erythrin-vacuolar iron transport family protein
LPLETIRKEAEIMELEAERFYAKAAEQAQDVGVRKLLGDLADMEKGHESLAAKLADTILIPDVRAEEDRTRKRMFVLQYVQPGLAGLMDRSVSTLAPLFAAAFRRPSELADLPRRSRSRDRRRHQHGLCGGAFR